MGKKRFSPDVIDAANGAVSMADLLSRAGVRLTARGGKMVGLCPFHREKSPSFTVYGDHAQCYGCNWWGRPIGFVMAHDGVGFVDAVKRLLDEGGLGDLDPARIAARAEETRAAQAAAEAEYARLVERDRLRDLDWWARAAPWQGSPVETYLVAARGLDAGALRALGLPRLRCASLYYQDGLDGARLGPFSVMLGLIRDRGRMLGVHRTYLRPDGLGKADVPVQKKTPKGLKGGSIALYSPRNPRRVVMGEGIETVLSAACAAMLAGRLAPDTAYLSSVSFPNFYGAAKHGSRGVALPGGGYLPSDIPDDHPGIWLPDSVQDLTWLRDIPKSDAEGMALLRRGMARARAHGVRSTRYADPPSLSVEGECV